MFPTEISLKYLARDPMTWILKHNNLDMVEMYLHAENEVSSLNRQKHTNTLIHTDLSEIIIYTHGNNHVSKILIHQDFAVYLSDRMHRDLNYIPKLLTYQDIHSLFVCLSILSICYLLWAAPLPSIFASSSSSDSLLPLDQVQKRSLHNSDAFLQTQRKKSVVVGFK